jgi:ERCC4-type nuclease
MSIRDDAERRRRRQTGSVGVRIVADVHEAESGIAALLGELGAEVEVAPMRAGDYAVSEDAIVERKRVLDLHDAVAQGRFWRQLGKLRAACAFQYLLVEGTDLDRGPLPPNAIRGVCLATIDLGIPLIRTDHQRDSARWIHRLAVRRQRTEAAPDRPVYAQRPKAVAGRDAAEALLSAAPGISAASARALLDHFGSVRAVLEAGPEQWLEVQGIGPDRARALAATVDFQHASQLRP